MKLDSTIALITLAEAQTFFSIDRELTEREESRLSAFINSASQFIMEKTERKFITPSAAIVERFPGNDKSEYLLKHGPVVTAPTLLQYITRGLTETWTTTTSAWTYDSEKAKIWFIQGEVFWSDISDMQNGNWRITYNYGYAVASIPMDLKMACADLVGFYKRYFENNLHGVKSEANPAGGGSTTYETEKLPESVQLAIAKYRRKY